MTRNLSKSILIVEPDPTSAKRLSAMLKDRYKLLFSVDGVDGIRQVKSHLPDLIICSLTIQKISCFLFVSLIRESPATADIPVILLTQAYSSNIYAHSFQSGIDGIINYQTQPQEIIARIDNHINKRKFLQKLYRQQPLPENGKMITTQMDKIIIERIEEIVLRNLSEVGVNALCQKIGMSRSILQQKVKIISGNTLGAHIRQIKLKKAKELLLHSNMLIYEVSEFIGFTSRQSFIKAFKRCFQLTPSAYRSKTKVS